ncbi:MAG: hypothetical protein AAGI07_00470 [Bacteroidota bacterium]
MWEIKSTEVQKDQVIKIKILYNNVALVIEKVIVLWINNEEFRNFYTNILKGSSFEAFFWEHPGITVADLQNTYEFVLVKSDSLKRVQPEPNTFKDYYKNNKQVVSFSNLRGDAQLIVPAPMNGNENYSHLAKFIKTASKDQIDEFWKKIGQVYKESLGIERKWLSTAGLGVYWLHVRVDSRPKYYRFAAYKG